ncbi:MAG: glucokinase [Nitrospirae bacterium]|nr:MAG: glucokinase [Nitrospirota bacterium]
MTEKLILSADIGGTNSRFALFKVSPDRALKMVEKIWLRTREATSFYELLGKLRKEGFGRAVDDAWISVIAVAGPVEDGNYSSPPYIPWDIDLKAALKKGLLKQAYLINDFIAQAYACLGPSGKGAKLIKQGVSLKGTPIGVVGAGTGLGKAVLVPVGDDYVALASEGGHGYFSFLKEREFEFLEFYRKNSGQWHITENLVVSGQGLRYIHWFLTGEELAPEEVTEKVKNSEETLSWMAGFYGRLCRDYALNLLCRGGLYIAGGVAARTPEIVLHPEFVREFCDSPTMGHILREIPIYLIDDQDSGLWGAALYGKHIASSSDLQ